MDEDTGDILVFLTGQDEIESMERLLRDRAAGLPPSRRGGGLSLMVVAIYASMPPEQQMKVSGWGHMRKGIRYDCHWVPTDKIGFLSESAPHNTLIMFESLPSFLDCLASSCQVFEPPPEGQRKVILATNIAETSITIGGVRSVALTQNQIKFQGLNLSALPDPTRYVIDTGVVKARGYNAKLGIDSLSVVAISQAQARQRSGRAGEWDPCH